MKTFARCNKHDIRLNAGRFEKITYVLQVEVLAERQGYSMVKRKGCVHFCIPTECLTERTDARVWPKETPEEIKLRQ
jgi:hypothetical protein